MLCATKKEPLLKGPFFKKNDFIFRYQVFSEEEA